MSTYERNIEPTPRRRQQARQQGHVARSHDLVSAVVLLTGLVALAVTGERLVRFLGGYTAQQLGGAAWLSVDAASMQVHFARTLHGLSQTLLPLLGLLVLGAVAAHLAQGGFMPRPRRIAPDASRLDPLGGLRRLFSPATASRLGFGVLKIVAIGAVAAVDLYAKRETLLALSGGSVPQIASLASGVLLWTSLKIGAALLALALADYGLQRWKHERDLRMTPQELREELRDLEGDPAIRSLQRRMRQELASDRLLASVSRADVVLAGASGAAVAIRYNPELSAPPVLVAKGAGELAQRIRRRAVAQGIAVVDRRRLAETLDREVEPGRPIPREHYAAVARILAQVHHQQGRELPEAA